MQKITLLGNLGRDPEERFTKNGHKVISWSLAVSPRKNQTVWYECQIWAKKIEMFEKILPYLKKGSRILVCGEFKTPETYQGKDGQTKIRLQLEPDFIQFVGSAQEKKDDLPQERAAVKQPEAVIELEDDLPF